MFLNRLCIYRSNGLCSGATPISDGIFLDQAAHKMQWDCNLVQRLNFSSLSDSPSPQLLIAVHFS